MIRPAVFVAVALLFTSAVVADDDVIVGNKENFDSIIAEETLTLVKFFAPWCGHCKKMAGDFKEAATLLKGKAQLVDLDATIEKDLAAKYGVRGFPTLKLFSKGEVISDYKGGRTKDALIKYIERSLMPSIQDCEDAAAVVKFAEENKGKSLFFGVALDKYAIEFKKASMALRDALPDSIAFASITSAADVKDLVGEEVDGDTVVLVRDDGSVSKFSGEPSEFEGWAKISSLPLYAELSRDTATVYTELDKPIAILFQDPEKKDADFNDAMTEVAKEHRSTGDMVFVWINGVELASFAEHVGAAGKTPSIAVYEFKTDTKYVFDEEFSKAALSAWVKKIVAGELSATTKSEPVPEKNDEPVKVIVGDTWESIVQDESKDVLVEQYAPWCGHCKKLAPILDDVAAKLSGVETLVIAKMDATKNDAPKEYKAQGYPTLHFFPAGVKKGTAYEGGRTAEDFIKFFKENATHKEGLDVDIGEKADAAGEASAGDAEKEEL